MRFLLIFTLLSWHLNLSGQQTAASDYDDRPYFQQEVGYLIKATLDDQAHTLHALLELRYTNNAPDTLRELRLHCWPRAFSTDGTAYARQALRNGDTRFHFSSPSERGTMDSLHFRVDGVTAQHLFAEEAPDIVIVSLPTPMLPGQTIELKTPFRVKIPASFSRLGRVGQSYQITQWYPKPAVYDREGWHEMPYLDQGEFYGEFGDFSVQITLPENYVVAATGTLNEAGEKTWLLKKAAADRERLQTSKSLRQGYVYEAFPPSAEKTKTLTYSASKVHDFAWFADKRFQVLHDTLQLPGRAAAVDVWAMFTETDASLWTKATDYLKRATRFYSRQVGNYPYPQVTGVQSALSAGGGMEYPMITVIGMSSSAKDLDQVLAHEVGHNWFYGILGSNERDHAWLDEGVNSFYERRYLARYWPDAPAGINFLGQYVDYNRLGYHYLARLGREQAPDTPSDSLSRLNYLVGAYSKPALALQELEAYVGTARLDAALQAYYDNWQFRHPRPEDFFRSLEHALQQELPYLRAALQTNQTSDWAIKGKVDAATGLRQLAHQGLRPAPAVAHLKMEDGTILTETVAPGTQELPTPAATSALSLPTAENPLDLYTHNNTRGARQLQLGLVTGQEQADQRQLFALPLLAFNEHDGIMPGLVLHNRTLEPRRLEWLAAPMIGTRSGSLNGLLGMRLTAPSHAGKLARLSLNIGLQQFSDFTLGRTNEAYQYQRLGTRLEYTFRHAPITQVSSKWFAQFIRLNRQRPRFDQTGEVIGARATPELFFRTGYQRSVSRTLSPFTVAASLEYKLVPTETAFNVNHLRLDAELRGGYQYEQDRFLRWRAYGGVFLLNDLRDRATRTSSGFSLLDNAESDYRYDDLFIGRNAGGRNEQQLGAARQGGFRLPISPAFGYGRSNNYLLAVNVDADFPGLPGYLPLVFFLDAGYYGFKAVSAEAEVGKFSWAGGVGFSVAEGRVGIYLPLVADPDTKVLLEQRGDLLQRATIRLSLADWLPWKWMDNLK